MSADRIHPQLREDCHHLGAMGDCELLLNCNASVPWFILVPDTRLSDVLDLPDEHREAVMAECVAVSSFIKQVLGYDKVNFAGLGNVVPQMHLHVIGRSETDPCWPQPVWGNLQDNEFYSVERLREWQDGLVRMAGLEPVAI